MTHLDLFSGIGGFALAAKWAGFTTVGFCEIDPYCQAVLRKHWPGVYIHDDIKTLKWPVADAAPERSQRRGDGGEGQPAESERLLSARPSEHGAITLLTGGFPCQPFSCAGKRRGKEDDRDLWPHMFRVIKEVRPTWVLGENVAGFVKMELDRSLSDLESIGYSCQAFVIPACATDAKHRRDRVWIVANSGGAEVWSQRGGVAIGAQNEGRGTRQDGPAGVCPRPKESHPTDARQAGQDVAHAEQQRNLRERGVGDGEEGTLPQGTPRPEEPVVGEVGDGGQDGADSPGWPTEPDLGLLASRLPAGLAGWCEWPEEPQEVPRVAVGVPERVNRLKALGNSIVPQVAYEIIAAIAQIERGKC